MKSKARAYALKTVGRLYKPHGSSRYCFYCGADYPEEMDHVPALNRVVQFGGDNYRTRGIPLVLVAACRPCNGTLSNRPLDTLEQRCVFLYRNAQRRFKSKLAHEPWTPAEIAELGPGLKPLIQTHATYKSYLWERLYGLSATITGFDDAGWPTLDDCR